MTDRFACARKFASKIVEAKDLTPPIDPAEIIKSYGIKIIEEENQLGIEAFSDLGKTPKITINTEITFPARKKFTLAHELGHIIIPWHNGDIKCDTDKPYNIISGQRRLDTQELEANIFASELLMPQKWLQQQINDSKYSFQKILDVIRKKAQTSVMACLYALEEALPSGNLYYVKKDNTDYWKKFSSRKTCTTELYGDFDERIEFLQQVCETEEYFNVSQYEIIYFSLFKCPDSSTIKNIYSESEDIVDLINIISDYNPVKTLLFLKDLLNALDEVYFCYIFENNRLIRNVAHENSIMNKWYSEYDSLIYILDCNRLNYQLLEVGNYRLIFIKEEYFELTDVDETDPNVLLKAITKELYSNNYQKVLQRINGIVSNANSKIKVNDEKLLYNIIKYRFAGAEDMIEFYNHPSFDLYVINKIRSMLNAREKKKYK